ncbi:MAG TPA: 4Fe-4S dicluster domain-containing protein [Thermoprotei archaeon]|nr:4Fe-4S dicluster domain-containing protein [Thermoprotei archaeon]
MPKPVVDKDKCTGCGTCAEICPMQVFDIVNGKAEPVRADQCVGCRACEMQCPAGAITVEE